MRPKRFGLEKVRKRGTFARQTNDWVVSKIKVCCCIPKLYLSNTESIETGEAWLRKQHTSNKKSSWQFSTFPKLGPLGSAKQIASVKRKYCSENSCSSSSFHKVVPFFHLLNFSFERLTLNGFAFWSSQLNCTHKTTCFLKKLPKLYMPSGKRFQKKVLCSLLFFLKKTHFG